MAPTLLIVFGLALGGAVASIRIHETPGVESADTKIEPGVEISNLEELAKALGLSSEWSLRIETSRKVSNGLTRHRIRLLYNGLRVRVFTLQASTDECGKFTSAVTGYIPSINNLDTSVSQTNRVLLASTVRFVNYKNDDRPDIDDIGVSDVENFETEKQIHIDVETGAASVVYFCRGLVDLPNYVRNPKVIFDANSLRLVDGSVLTRKMELPQSDRDRCPAAQGGNTKVPGLTYGYGDGAVCLHAHVRGDYCYLANSRVRVKSCGNQWDRKNCEIVKFVCADGLNDNFNGAFSPSADAFYYSQAFYNMLYEWADLNITGKEPLVLYTHFGENYGNSYFDGYSITFGNGHWSSFPFTVRDLIAHEMCHGLTDSLENLRFQGESIAIDEGFSDLCGKALSAYLSPHENDWRFGFDILKDEDRALRYFDFPSRYQDYIIDNYANADQADDPTQLRGILHKFFYLVVTKGNVPIRDAFEAMIHANVIYFQDETSFLDGTCGILRSANDLALDTGAFRKAFQKVGIELDFCSLQGTLDNLKGPGKFSRNDAKVSQFKRPSYKVNGGSDIFVKVDGPNIQVDLLDEDGNIVASGENEATASVSNAMYVRLEGQGLNDESVAVGISVD